MDRLIRTDDPVRDAELHQIDLRPVRGRCEVCDTDLHGRHGAYGGDTHYDIPGYGLICEGCLGKWAKDFLVED